MAENLTPLAVLLYDFMWSYRPRPLSATKFASMAHVSKQALWNWLNGRSLPQPTTLAQISQNTGIPLEKLYAAVAASPVVRRPTSVWEYIIERVERAPDFDEPTRTEILGHIEELREQYSTDGEPQPGRTLEEAASGADGH